MTADTSLLPDIDPSAPPTRDFAPPQGGLSTKNAVLAVAVLISIAVAAALFIGRGPATVFVDANGRIIEFRQGELSADELEDGLDRLTLKKATS